MEAYFFKEQTKETIQEIHRLRANKRTQVDLRVVFVSKDDFTWLCPNITQLDTTKIKNLPRAYSKTLSTETLQEIEELIQDNLTLINAYHNIYKQDLENCTIESWSGKVNQLLLTLNQCLEEITQEIQALVFIELQHSGQNTWANKIRSATQEVKRTNGYIELNKSLEKFGELIGEVNIPRLF